MEKGVVAPALRWFGRTSLDFGYRLEQIAKDSRETVGDFLAQIMTPEERERFSLERYSLSTVEPKEGQPLKDWEEVWFQEDLPAAPASLLVPGCGAGREVVPLLERGYDIVGFDGAPGAFELAKKVVEGRADLRLATFSDLVDSVFHQNSRTPLSDLRQRSFDAVLLGWGSITHVATPQRRRDLLRACCHLTSGPVLASFFSKPGEAPSRAARFGQHVARSLGRTGVGPSPVQFSHWGGFAEYVTKEEIAAHAAVLGRNVKWSEGGSRPFPSITLLPRGA